MTRHRVVRLVAVHVDHQAPLFRDLAKRAYRPRTFRHGPFKMGNTAHHVDAQIQRLGQEILCFGMPEVAVLREGDQLQVDPGAQFFTHL